MGRRACWWQGWARFWCGRISTARSIRAGRNSRRAATELSEEVESGVKTPIVLNVVFVILGIGLLVFGAEKLVANATSLADA